MFVQEVADQQFLDEVARRYPNSPVRGKLEEAIKKYPKMYKNVIARAKAAPKTVQDESWKEYAKTQYGWIVDLYDAVPDLKKIVDEAVQLKFTKDRFLNAVKSTAWWKTTEAKERAFVEETASDPATQKTNIDAKRLEISNYVGKQGYTLPDTSLANLATQAYKYGWNTDEIGRYVGAEILKTGAAGTTVTPSAPITGGMDARSIRSLANDYGLKLSDNDINAYAQGLIGKTVTIEQIKENMRMDAENLYPSLAKQLSAGRNITQATAAYKALAASTLGVDPETIDFSDPNKWGKLLSYVDPKTNEARLMTNAEWSRFVRGQPEYMETDEAKSLFRDAASMIARGFGKVIG